MVHERFHRNAADVAFGTDTKCQGTYADIAAEKYSGKTLHRMFVIGGATVYKQALEFPIETPNHVDRILLTRILSPSFEDCDVFMPNFQKMAEKDSLRPWVKRTHQDLQEWVGFEVPEGVQTENGVEYEFQMWTRWQWKDEKV